MDLFKGYWQVPLTDRAKQTSDFVMPDGLYQISSYVFWPEECPGHAPMNDQPTDKEDRRL